MRKLDPEKTDESRRIEAFPNKKTTTDSPGLMDSKKTNSWVLQKPEYSWQGRNYTVVHKKVHPFSFYNKCVKCSPN